MIVVISIPNVITNKTKEAPNAKIIEPAFPKLLINGTAASVPKAPPPDALCAPSLYAIFNISDIFINISVVAIVIIIITNEINNRRTNG